MQSRSGHVKKGTEVIVRLFHNADCVSERPATKLRKIVVRCFAPGTPVVFDVIGGIERVVGWRVRRNMCCEASLTRGFTFNKVPKGNQVRNARDLRDLLRLRVLELRVLN